MQNSLKVAIVSTNDLGKKKVVKNFTDIKQGVTFSELKPVIDALGEITDFGDDTEIFFVQTTNQKD